MFLSLLWCMGVRYSYNNQKCTSNVNLCVNCTKRIHQGSFTFWNFKKSHSIIIQVVKFWNPLVKWNWAQIMRHSVGTYPPGTLETSNRGCSLISCWNRACSLAYHRGKVLVIFLKLKEHCWCTMAHCQGKHLFALEYSLFRSDLLFRNYWWYLHTIWLVAFL